MEQRHIESLRELQAKLANGTEITSEDVNGAREIVRRQPTMYNRVLFATLSARHHTLQETVHVQEVDRPTAEQLEAARTAAKVNPSNRNLSAYAILKRQTGL